MSPDPTTRGAPRGIVPTIVFSHANSFPAGTYSLLFDAWREAGYTVHALDKFGHDAHYPVTPDWPHLVRHLHDFVTREVKQPAYLVGHSLGGYLSMMLAARHPSLARGVVVLDSPLIAGWRASALGLAKRMGQMQRIMPSRIAAQRCHQWPSLQAAREHFLAKPKFTAFHPQVLDDYLRHGIHSTHGTGDLVPNAPQQLSFSRDIERDIYNTMPHRLLREFRRQPLRCPVAFIGGKRSSELRSVGMGGTRQLVGQRLSWIEGTHLYPFERPLETAAEVLKWLHQFEA